MASSKLVLNLVFPLFGIAIDDIC